MTLNTICITCTILVTMGISLWLYNHNDVIRLWVATKKTKDVEKNPKWATKELQSKYYGFHDLDIVLVDDPIGLLPRFRLEKHTNKLQLLIPADTTIRDLDDIAPLALAGKIKIKYGVWYPEKSAQWLSILNYLLDGGDIKLGSVNLEDEKEDKKPVDL